MSNMSYCRFQNTVTDMRDCLDYLQNNGYEGLSVEEINAAIQMNDISEQLAEELEFIG